MSKVTKFLEHLAAVPGRTDMFTQEQGREWGNRYWQIRQDKSLTAEEIQVKLGELQATFKEVKDCHVNAQGNTVIRRNMSTDRYMFDGDEDFRALGFEQFDTDQDASYFGMWVNPKTFQTFTYAEGDCTLVVCPDALHYNAEIEAACKFYRPGFEMIACDMEAFQSIMLGGDPAGEATIYRQDRAKFFAEVAP